MNSEVAFRFKCTNSKGEAQRGPWNHLTVQLYITNGNNILIQEQLCGMIGHEHDAHIDIKQC